eukprot:TRINITY_DN41946_c0_g1_i1.p1 TRINITY_DN41946_c0_g1~~TRINITY_DN41946_c0_g1_i1.p1  ORF type:complete len:178 (+),score=7.04 TRINITY_DN41946_c0_g1_i1:345-878(+)
MNAMGMKFRLNRKQVRSQPSFCLLMVKKFIVWRACRNKDPLENYRSQLDSIYLGNKRQRASDNQNISIKIQQRGICSVIGNFAIFDIMNQCKYEINCCFEDIGTIIMSYVFSDKFVLDIQDTPLTERRSFVEARSNVFVEVLFPFLLIEWFLVYILSKSKFEILRRMISFEVGNINL